MVKYIEILFRFKFRFAFLLLLLPAVVGGITVLLFPSYRASAQLWVDDPSYFGGSTPAGWSQYLTSAQNEQDSLIQLLSTRSFNEDLYRRLATDIPNPTERSAAVNGSKLTIAAAGTHLISVTATCVKQPDCIALVNRSVEALRDEQIQMEKDNAAAGVTFLTSQMQQAKTSQTGAEDALRKYIASHPGIKVDSNTDPNTINDPELSRLATEVQAKRSAVNNLQDQINRNSNIASASTALIQAGPRMVDPPLIQKGGLTGDGSGLRKAALTGGAVLALGAVYLFLLGWLDKTLRDPHDIERRFKLPVVTTIPELQPSERF
jgi:capsular polysaccharide biosynthesis protein